MPQLVVAALPVIASALSIEGPVLYAITAFSMVASYAIQRSLMPGAPDPQAITRNIKNPVAPRRIIYGKRRVGGTIVYAGTTDDDNYLHMMVALAGHEVQSITDVYMNDKKLEEYDNAGQKQRVYVKWGATHEVGTDSFSITVNGTDVYSGTIQAIIDALRAVNYEASGSYLAYQKGDAGIDAWDAQLSIKPPKVDDLITVTATAGGAVTYSSSSSTVLYRVNTHLGSPTQLADTDAVTEIPEWTIDHKLQGIAYLYVRVRYERESFPTGVPNITALVEGKKDIYDPRDAGSYGYTNNAALCAADYLHSGMFGFGAEYGTDIDTTALIAAANACDESVVLSDASTEPRYLCNGVIDTSQTPKNNLANLLTSMVGSCVFVGGKWKFYAGVYRSPLESFDESDLRAGLTIQTKRSRSNICNGVKGTYIYANDDESSYQPADFPSVTNALYKSEDGDVDIWKDLALEYTTSASMAQRIAKIELEKARQGITFKFPAKLTALNTTTGDVVNISNARLQWTNKPFEVVDWEFSIADAGELGVDLTLQETASGIYNWANGEETTTDLAKNSNLPNPGYVAPVSAISIEEVAVVNAAGDEVVNVKVSWLASVSQQVDHYEVEGALATATSDDDWVGQITSGTHYQVDGVASGLAYLVRVRAVSVYGSKSQWETVGFYADGINEIPIAPSGLAVTTTVDTITATWTNNIASEWMRGTNIYAATVNDRADASFGLVTLVGGDATQFSHSVPGGTTYYIWIATVAKNGQTSEFYPVSATGGISSTALVGGLTPEQIATIGGLEDVIDDLVYDPVEKRASLNPWYDAIERFTTSASEATTFGITAHTQYIDFLAAATTVGEYMEEIFDLTVTGGVGGLVFDYGNVDNPSYFPTYTGDTSDGNVLTFTRAALTAAWKAYYQNKNVLDAYVTSLLTTQQQSEINDVTDYVSGISDDGICGIDEKQTFKVNWQAAVTDFNEIATKVTDRGLTGESCWAELVTAAENIIDLMASIWGTPDHNTVTDWFNDAVYTRMAHPTYFSEYSGSKDPNGWTSTYTKAQFNSYWQTYWTKKKVMENRLSDWAAVQASDVNAPADNADVTATVLPTLNRSDFPTTVTDELDNLQNQLDDKFVIWVQDADPSGSWSGTDAEHTGDHWKNTTTDTWYTYSGTAWGAASDGVAGLFSTYDTKTTYHATSSTSDSPSAAVGAVGDFAIHQNITPSPDTYQMFEKTAVATWTARSGTWTDGADVTTWAAVKASDASAPEDNATVNQSDAITNSAINTAATTSLGSGISGDIVGNTVQTSTTGQRIVVNATGDELEFYNSSGSKVATIGQTTYGLDEVIGYFGVTPIDLIAVAGRSTTPPAAVFQSTGTTYSTLQIDHTPASTTGANGILVNAGIGAGIVVNVDSGSVTYGLQVTHNGNATAATITSDTGDGLHILTTAGTYGLYVQRLGGVAIKTYGSAEFGGSLSATDASFAGGNFSINASGNITNCGTITAKSLDLGATGDITCDNINCNGVSGSAVYYSGSYSSGTKIVGLTTSGVAEIGGYIDFHYGGSSADHTVRITGYSGYILVSGYVDASAYYLNGSQIAFTGGHLSYSSDLTLVDGDIVAVTDSTLITVTQSFQELEAAQSIKDKRAIGVVAKIDKTQDKFNEIYIWCTKSPDEEGALDERIFLNADAENFYNGISARSDIYTLKTASLGEGGINVCPENGNIESGDYICSSSTPGKGMKQDDDLLHNYTVAKALESVLWTQEEIDNNTIKMIACTYHCG